MRTTLTLDDELASKLKELANRRRLTFKEVLNSTLRRGLSVQETGPKEKRPFRVDPFNSPFRPGVDSLRLNELTDEIETRHAGRRTR